MKYLFGVIFIASCTERRTAPFMKIFFVHSPLDQEVVTQSHAYRQSQMVRR